MNRPWWFGKEAGKNMPLAPVSLLQIDVDEYWCAMEQVWGEQHDD